jgi:hypothetical protein
LRSYVLTLTATSPALILRSYVLTLTATSPAPSHVVRQRVQPPLKRCIQGGLQLSCPVGPLQDAAAAAHQVLRLVDLSQACIAMRVAMAVAGVQQPCVMFCVQMHAVSIRCSQRGAPLPRTHPLLERGLVLLALASGILQG